MTDVTIVTPWHAHLELAEDYWNAVAHTGAQVLVVDNGSEPPLPNAVRLDRNEGFSRACNVGLELARTDVVCFLNNDVFATDPGWLAAIVGEVGPGVLVGPQLRTDQHTFVDGERLPYLDGWCLAGMRDDLLELGGFDEAYEEPAYYSDNDLCFRARLAGMALREIPAGIHHKGGATSNANGWVLPATAANRARFEERVRDALGVSV